MSQYEITYLTKEEEKEPSVKKDIESLDGKVVNVNPIGERQLAYKVKKQTAAFYTTVVFEMDPVKVMELNKKLALDQDILRHLIITYKAPSVVVKTEKPAVKMEAAKPEEQKEEVKVETLEAEPVEEVKEKTEKAPAKEAKTETKKEPTEEEKIESQEKEEPKVKEEKPKKAPAKRAEKKEKVKSAAVQEAEHEELSTEERLKALDEKLDELLKD